MRRARLRSRANILYRMLIHVGAFNLSLIMRKSLGYGTLRGLATRLWHLFDRVRPLHVLQHIHHH